MSKSGKTTRRVRLIIVTIAVGWLLVMFAKFLGEHSPLRSSPTEKRAGAAGIRFLEERTRFDAFVNSDQSIPIATTPEEGFFSFDLGEVTEVFSSVRRAPVKADDSGEILLPEDASARLEAYVLRVPGQSKGAFLLPRDPRKQKPLAEERLGEIPDKILIDDRQLHRPRLSLIFKASESLRFFHAADVAVFDQRTGVRVDFGQPHEVSSGPWTRLDLEMGIWHDTPLEIGLDLLCGKPEVIEPAREDAPVSQIAPAGLGTPFFNEGGDGVILRMDSRRAHIHIAPVFRPSLQPENAYLEVPEDSEASVRASLTARRHENFGLLIAGTDWDEPPEIRWFGKRWGPGDFGGNQISLEQTLELVSEPKFARQVSFSADQALKTMKDSRFGMVHLPEQIRAWFELKSLPEMPGDSDLKNLFDTPIPEITIDISVIPNWVLTNGGEPYGSLGTIYVGSPAMIPEEVLDLLLLEAACRAVELDPASFLNQHGSHLFSHGFLERGEPFSRAGRDNNSFKRAWGHIRTDEPSPQLTRRISNTTPWQLLEAYNERQDSPVAFVVADDFQLQTTDVQPTRLEKIKEWWAENAPDWLQF